MDVDTAWDNFRKSNKTSVDDKLDVIMAQQQEILNDTSRTADLVPLVTGDKAEQDALEETGDLEGDAGMAEGGPTDGMSDIAPDESLDDTGEETDEDNPFSFLDEESEDESYEESEESETDEEFPEDESEEEPEGDYEETDEESDIMDFPEDESPEPEEGESEDDYTEDDESEVPSQSESEGESDEGEPDEESEEEPESEEESEESEDEDYISFDEIDEESEDEEDKTKKSAPATKTIKSYASDMPMRVVNPTSAPSPAISYGRASNAEEISNMLMKSNKSADDDFEIGYGVDPHKVVEKDWIEYHMMKKLNLF